MGLLHLVQMAVEPVGSENIIQEFDKHQSMAEISMSSDTRSLGPRTPTDDVASPTCGPNSVCPVLL